MERPVKQGQRVEVFVSDRALAVICWLVVAFHLIFTVLGAIPGLAYTPRHKDLWLASVAALLALALWQETRNRAHHGHWLLLMPVLSAAVLRLFIPADGMGLWQCGLALVVLILGGALFARAGAGRGFRLAAGILCATVLVPTLMMMLLTAFIGPPNITLRRYPDPTGHLEAEVRVVDEGATGGSTTVTVCQDWPFGLLDVVRGKTTLDWIDPDALEVAWMDEDTISINGRMWRWKGERGAA